MSNVYDWWHVLSNWSLFIGRVNYPTISHSTNATWGPLSFVSKSLPLTICNTPDFGTPPRFNHETYCNHIGITPPKTKKHRPLNYEIVGRQKTHHLNFPLEKNMRLICRGGGTKIGSKFFAGHFPGSKSAGLTTSRNGIAYVTSNKLDLSGNKQGGKNTPPGDVGKTLSGPMSEHNEMKGIHIF